MENEPVDPLPDMIASLDQAIMMATHIARWARGLYNAFRNEGFTEEQSLILAMGQMRSHDG